MSPPKQYFQDDTISNLFPDTVTTFGVVEYPLKFVT